MSSLATLFGLTTWFKCRQIHITKATTLKYIYKYIKSPLNINPHSGEEIKSSQTSTFAIRYLIYFVHTALISTNEFCHTKPDRDDLKLLPLPQICLSSFEAQFGWLAKTVCHSKILIIRVLR